MNEGTFAIFATLLVVISLVGALVVADNTDSVDSIGWSPPMSDVHDHDPPIEPGIATVDGEDFETAQGAIDAAKPGDTVVLEGYFAERLVVETANVRILGADGATSAIFDGEGSGTVLEIQASNVTVSNIWIHDSGDLRANEDAAIFVNGSDARIVNARLTAVTFGVWINGASGVTVEGTTIVGKDSIYPLTNRGNGIHLWDADGAVLRDNRITSVRDGIFYSWSENVLAEDNVIWNVRYGVHYMYSDDNILRNNTAYNNDVGFALMVSKNLTIDGNLAIDNRGQSSHGIFVKDIEQSQISNNVIVNNGNGFYVYNAHDNVIADNLVQGNNRGISVAAGSSGELVVGNSFVNNDHAAYVDTRSQVSWNDSDRGNYWSDARTVDLDGNGISEIRYQPAGTVERLVYEYPQAAVFADSPAFDTVQLAESSFPVIETPGAVDHHPLVEPNHDPMEYQHEYRN